MKNGATVSLLPLNSFQAHFEARCGRWDLFFRYLQDSLKSFVVSAHSLLIWREDRTESFRKYRRHSLLPRKYLEENESEIWRKEEDFTVPERRERRKRDRFSTTVPSARTYGIV